MKIGLYHREIDSILELDDSLPLKLNQLCSVRSDFMKFCKEDLLANIFKSVEGMFEINYQSNIWKILLIYNLVSHLPQHRKNVGLHVQVTVGYSRE